jgi:uncharacterized protein with PIN domain
MIVLDAYALTAMLADEPAAQEVGELIANEGVAIPSPNLAEAVDRLGRIYGLTFESTRSAVETLEQGTELQIRALEREHAWCAARLRIEHYHRTRRPLSLGDCLLLAAVGKDERVATADPHVLDTAEAERIAWVALPDSRGRRHKPKS